MKEDKIVISLGGSLVVPDDIDILFLREFKTLISAEANAGKKIFIMTGGGKIAREYQKIAKEISNPTDEDLDLIGIRALNLNAELVRVLFKDVPNVEAQVHGRTNPGASTDTGSVKLALEKNAKTVINLSNTDYVYDSDPKTNPNAKKIENISWAMYRSIIPKKWTPGLNTPFDPIASEIAEKEGIEVVIINGKPLNNFAKYLKGEKFAGTIIK